MPSEVRGMDAKFRARFRRRLCYGGGADLDTPSLPLTEVAVDYFHDNMPGPEGLDRLDLDAASKISGQTGVSPCSMVMSVLYAKRLRHRNTKYLQAMSSSDIFFISMMMASKYLYDEGVDEEVFNDEWADTTGQEVEEVNQMEIDFLNAMDWRLFVKPEEFEDVLATLERRLALKEGLKRGWFTYTELNILLDTQLMYSLWNQVGWDCSKLATVLSTTYLASVMSMVGSAALAVHLSGPLTTATVAILSMQTSLLFGPSISSVSPSVSMNPHFSLTLGEALSLDDHPNLSRMFDESDTLRMEPRGLGEESEVTLDHDLFNHSKTRSELPDAEDVRLEDSNGTSDSTENGTESQPVKAARSSVLSLWFFDSLLSQIWSILETKPRSHHFDTNCMNCRKPLRRDPNCCERNNHSKLCMSPQCQRSFRSGHKVHENPKARASQRQS